MGYGDRVDHSAVVELSSRVGAVAQPCHKKTGVKEPSRKFLTCQPCFEGEIDEFLDSSSRAHGGAPLVTPHLRVHRTERFRQLRLLRRRYRSHRARVAA